MWVSLMDMITKTKGKNRKVTKYNIKKVVKGSNWQ